MGNCAATLRDRRLTIDEALHVAAHATVTYEPHRMGNPPTSAVDPDRHDEQAGPGWPAGSRRVPTAVREPASGGPPDAEAAFREFVVPEVDVLLRVALSITRSVADAEDLVQDTLLRAYRSMESFDGRHPRAWLLTILRNAEVNRTRRPRPGLLDDPDEVVRRLSASDDRRSEPETILMDGLFDEHLDAALRGLPERFRIPIELVDVDELSYEEAAAILDVPVGTVTSRLSRGRKRLRDHLKRVGALHREAPK